MRGEVGATLANLRAAQPVLDALVKVGATIISVSADDDRVDVLTFRWQPMYDDEVAICHAANTGTLVEATSQIGANGKSIHRTWNLGLVRVNTYEPLPVLACECGKPIEHLDVDPDGSDWPCRVPVAMLVRECESVEW